jgi:hypothetical protein
MLIVSTVDFVDLGDPHCVSVSRLFDGRREPRAGVSAMSFLNYISKLNLCQRYHRFSGFVPSPPTHAVALHYSASGMISRSLPR